MKYTKEKITELFSYAVELFNDTMGEEYSVGDNGIMPRFFTPDNGIEVYEEFCSTYFPRHLNEDYRHREKFENMVAEAFVSEGHMGVMIRTDLPFSESELLQIFAHEIAHIYCTLNEIKGENFYTKLCDDPDHPVYGENISTQMNGYINAGYAIWREAIADIISVETTCDVIPYQFTKKMVTDAYDQVQYGNPYAKRAASNMITYAVLQKDDGKNMAVRFPKFNKNAIRMLTLIEEKLSNQPFFEITPEFITEIGALYLRTLSEKLSI